MMKDYSNIDELQKIFDFYKTLDVMVYCYDTKSRAITLPDDIEKKIGLSNKVFTYKVWEKLLHPEDRKKVNEWKKCTINNGQPDKLQYRIILPNEEVRWIEDHITPVDELGQNFLGLIVDITERKTTEQKYKYMAFHDALTGLPNRNMLSEYMNNNFRTNQNKNIEMAVMFIDLDSFKNVNDNLGHDVGDLVLKHFSERLSKCLRVSDTVFRQGGDEFIVLLKKTNPSLTEKVAKRILMKISQPFAVEDKQIHLSASIGISIYPTHGTTLETLIKYADEAMYNAKNAGISNYRFYSP